MNHYSGILIAVKGLFFVRAGFFDPEDTDVMLDIQYTYKGAAYGLLLIIKADAHVPDRTRANFIRKYSEARQHELSVSVDSDCGVVAGVKIGELFYSIEEGQASILRSIG